MVYAQVLDPKQVAAQLETWWTELAQEEIMRVVPKACEYGSHDLYEIGRNLAHCQGRTEERWDGEWAEQGIYFYLVGKMARWTDAVQQGRKVSDDSLHDIGVYVRMAQRIRDVGGWPSGPGAKSGALGESEEVPRDGERS